MPIDERMRARLHEARGLGTAGRLLEATATIQRKLRSLLAPEDAPDDGAPTTDAPIEGGFQGADVDTVAPPPGFHPQQGRSRQPAVRFRAPMSEHWRQLFARPSGPAPTLGQTRGVEPDARFVSGSYTNQAGTRSYKLYVPSRYKGQALPLVVMLHGCNQNPDDFAAGTCMNSVAEEYQCFVVYPAQVAAANQSNCWNWFKATDQQRDRGEPSLIAGITRQIIGTYSIDTQRVYVAGLSAGGAMSAVMGVTYPDLYAAIGVHSGLPYAAAHDLPSAFAAMSQGAGAPGRRQHGNSPEAVPCTQAVPAIVFHGDHDTQVHPRNGDQVIAQWTAIHREGAVTLQVSSQHGQVPDGHAYTRDVYQDASGRSILEQWRVHGAGHAWSGGSPNGSYTDPRGPDATREMIRFFHEHPLPAAAERNFNQSS
jgi:poly(hydroxyalkanoate) depolymerase family esterase